MPINMTGTPDIEPKLHWNNSANVLCNYMKKPEFLEMILQNQAIIPRYVIEPLDYLNIDYTYEGYGYLSSIEQIDNKYKLIFKPKY